MEEAMLSPASNAHLRLSLRAAANAVLLVLPLVLPLAAWVSTRGSSTASETHLLAVVAKLFPILGCLCFSYFSATYLFRKIGAHRLTDASSPTPAWLKASLVGLHIGVFLALFLVPLITGHAALLSNALPLVEALRSLAGDPLLLPLLVLVPIGFVAVTHALARERRQYETWGCLDIDT
jgi:hypothetical protein